MPSTDQTRGEFGSLERWTIGFFAFAVFAPVVLNLAGAICLVLSRFWTVPEKLIGFFGPPLLALAVGGIFFGLFSVHSWMRIPLMITLAGIAQFGTAAYLYFRAGYRSADAAAVNA